MPVNDKMISLTWSSFDKRKFDSPLIHIDIIFHLQNATKISLQFIKIEFPDLVLSFIELLSLCYRYIEFDSNYQFLNYGSLHICSSLV